MAVMVFYLPALFFVCWIAGLITGAIVKAYSQSLLLYRDTTWGGVLAGMFVATASVATLHIWFATSGDVNGWNVLSKQLISSLLTPIFLGGCGAVVTKFAHSASKHEAVAFRSGFTVGCPQAAWLAPVVGVLYSSQSVLLEMPIFFFMLAGALLMFGAVLADFSFRHLRRVLRDHDG